jgi:hypothetical protein
LQVLRSGHGQIGDQNIDMSMALNQRLRGIGMMKRSGIGQHCCTMRGKHLAQSRTHELFCLGDNDSQSIQQLTHKE